MSAIIGATISAIGLAMEEEASSIMSSDRCELRPRQFNPAFARQDSSSMRRGSPPKFWLLTTAQATIRVLLPRPPGHGS